MPDNKISYALSPLQWSEIRYLLQCRIKELKAIEADAVKEDNEELYKFAARVTEEYIEIDEEIVRQHEERKQI